MKFYQKQLQLPSFNRGFHIVTNYITEEFTDIKRLEAGFLQIFIQHTSASIAINENADPTVREDFERHFNNMVPENMPYYRHNYEGPDDMPAHIKAALLGNSVLVPITKGRMNLGTWQGIYLCEHRDRAGSRKLVLTAFGEERL